MPDRPPDPRRACLDLLNALDRSGKTLDRLMDDMGGGFLPHDARDRALFHALTYGVLRWRGRLDWVVSQFSRTPVHRIDPKVLNILRMALFQILFLDKVPDAAAVNTAVELTKSVAGGWVVRFVNGVLRNAARGRQAMVEPKASCDPVAALSVRYAFPPWLVERWIRRHGFQATADICRAVNAVPPVTLRANTLKISRAALAEKVAPLARRAATTPYAPEGVSLFGLRTDVSRMAAFREGLFQVQDEAAQLVTRLLDPRPGETVLDACAGLGGKTGHIAQMMGDRGRVVALDRSPGKLARLRSEMRRLGVSTVTTAAADLDHPQQGIPEARFDRVLLDAPCSGLGVLRRNPDAKWRPEKRDLNRFGRRQALFLSHLAGRVKPSGVLVYAVCSTEPEENGAVVKDFLNNHPGFAMETPGRAGIALDETLLDDGGFLTTCPHRHRTDGFFAARFRRIE